MRATCSAIACVLASSRCGETDQQRCTDQASLPDHQCKAQNAPFLLLVACYSAIQSEIPMDCPTITAALLQLQQNDKLHPLPQQIDALPLRAHIVSSQITYVVQQYAGLGCLVTPQQRQLMQQALQGVLFERAACRRGIPTAASFW
jgi:hypothetical protein